MSGYWRIFLGMLLGFAGPIATGLEDHPPGEGVPDGLNTRRLPTLTPPRGPRRLALCIGIDGSPGTGYPSLKCAIADAKELGRSLQAAGYEVTVMTDDAEDGLKPNYSNLEHRLSAFVRHADHPDDTLLITFAGHGDKIGDEVGLLPLDYGQIHQLISIRLVLDSLASSPCRARKKMLVIDGCRSPTEQPQRRLGNGFVKSFGTPDDLLVLTGCGDNQSSLDDSASGHSRLTQALLDGLAARKAFVKDHEFLLAEEWLEYVQATFRERGWGKQELPQRLGQIGTKVRFDIARRELPKLPPFSFADKRFVALSLQRAQDAFTNRDYLAAVEETNKALRSTEPRADAPAIRAMAYLQLGYQDKALADTDAVLAAEPENAVALQVKGIVEFNNGAYAAARSHLARASTLVESAPGRWPFLASGSPAADRWVRLGYTAIRSGSAADLPVAIDQFSRVLTARGATPEQVLHALIGRIVGRDHAGKPELAAADYAAVTRGQEISPEQTGTLLVDRGVAYGKQNKLELEDADYSSVIAMKNVPPDLLAWALFNRGICYGEQGRMDAAMADYTAAIQMKEASAEAVTAAMVNRGLWHQRLGKPEAAIADYTAAIELKNAPHDQSAKALVNRGICYHQIGKTEPELADYTAVIAMLGAPPSELASAFINRGILRTQQGKLEMAIADYTSVIRMKNAPPEELAAAFVNRAWRSYVAGALTEAADDSRRAAEINPTDPRPAYNLALILIRQQKFSAARDAYRLALTRGLPQAEVLSDLTELQDTLNGPPETGVFRGWMRLQNGEKEQGRADLTAYLDKHAKGPLAGFARELLASPLARPTVAPQ